MNNEEEILKKYKLTDKEHDEYYDTIKRIYVGGKMPQKNPVAIIVGGQTGAGKSPPWHTGHMCIPPEAASALRKVKKSG